MAKFTYVGDPKMNKEIKGNTNPSEIQYMGVTFPMGEAVDVNAEMASRLEGNSHFKKDGGAAKATKAKKAN